MESISSGKKLSSIFIAVPLGLIVGLLYLGFEWIVNNGSNWLWNDLVQSDVYRWRVIPLATIMSLLLSGTVLLFGQKRVLPPSLSLLDEMDDIKRTSIGSILVIIVIGGLSLIAGASLGPEASLVAASMGVAAWLSSRSGLLRSPIAFIFSISSLGALLAAFFNSLLPVIIPILILKQKGKLNALSFLIVAITGVISWGVVKIIKDEAYIQVPVSGTFSFDSFALAVTLGLLATIVALVVKWVIHFAIPLVNKINTTTGLIISSLIFGAVLGLLYFIGGQTIQFSGSEGLKLLGKNPAQYSVVALFGLVLMKMLATAWSTASGYRGGLVFPSIYMGVTFSLAIVTIFDLTGASESGAIIGAVTGVLVAMTSPILGIVLAFALFPFNLFSVVVGAVVGSLLGVKSLSAFQPEAKKSK